MLITVSYLVLHVSLWQYLLSLSINAKAFGRPTRALRIDISNLPGGAEQWDESVIKANEEYRTR